MASANLLPQLADTWEAVPEIRQLARESRRIVLWPTPETVGIASMPLAPLVLPNVACVYMRPT